MGGKLGSIGAIVLGVVIGVVAVVTQQYYLLFSSVSLIAGGAIGLVMTPEIADQQGNQAQELQISAAQVGNPVPVVFGRGRILPNFGDYSETEFRVDEVRGETQGGKGGGSSQPAPVVGYDYFLTWELYICMGPVDRIGQVWSVPGEVPMIDAPDPWTGFVSNELELTFAGESEGGIVRVYDGAGDQTRNATGDPYASKGMNNRNVCWALMGPTTGFLMGRQPTPHTYQFEVERIPDTSLDDTTSSGIFTRGSSDTLNPAYNSANPVAAMYECLVNKVWGRGLSSDLIDLDSWISAADYFSEQNIGFDYVLASSVKIGDFLEDIRRHFKLLLVWDGEQYTIRNLLDPSDSHGAINVLNANEIINLRVRRPLWESQINEIRAEYVSSERNFRRDVVHVQNLATFDFLGARTVPQRIQLPGFAYRALAFKQATRTLYDMSYPYLTGEWEMNRFKSQVQIGDCVRVDWDEFATGTISTYWLVIAITDGASDDENIKITAIEDPLLSPTTTQATPGTETIPTPNWLQLTATDDAEIDLHVPPDQNDDPVTPITSIEVPAILTGGLQHRLLVLGEKPTTSTLGVQALFSTDDSDFVSLGSSNSLGVTGALDAIMPSFGIDRTSTGIEFTITDQTTHGTTLEAVVELADDNDHMMTLLNKEKHFVVIDQEIMAVGLFEQVSASTYRMRNIIRGLFGTNIRSHAATATIYYLANKSLGVDGRQIPVGVSIYFKGNPIGLKGVSSTAGTSFQPDHEGSEFDDKYLGVGQLPLGPESLEIVDNGATVTITIRPRFYNTGAGVDDFWTVVDNPLQTIGEMTFAVEQFDNTMTSVTPDGQPVANAHTFTAGTLDDITSGKVSLTVTKEAGAIQFRVHQVLGTKRSIDFASFAI